MPVSFEKCNDAKPFHTRIQALQKVGVTQTKIARECKRSQASISYMVNNPLENPRVANDVVDGVRRLERMNKAKLIAAAKQGEAS